MHLTPKIECALSAARQYPSDLMHLEQVARLSAMLFEALHPLHQMDSYESELLCCAALLHDIGLSVSLSGHHKHSLQLILQSDLPALTADERLIVANIGRYHRKAKPSQKHKSFRALAPKNQKLVRRLAAILRIADGLDRAHENAVNKVEASASAPALLVIGIYGGGDLAFAAWGAERKSDLFEEVYGVELRIEPKGPCLEEGRAEGS